MGEINWRDYPYTTRAINVLRCELGDDRFFAECKSSMVWSITEHDLLFMPNMGKSTVAAIKNVLARDGGRLLGRNEPHPVSTLNAAARHAAEAALGTLKHCGHASVKDTEVVLEYTIKGEQFTEVPPEHQPHITGAIRVTIEFL